MKPLIAPRIFVSVEDDKYLRQHYSVPGDAYLGWHFIREDRCLRFGDNRLVEVGQTLIIPDGDTPELCHRGMHASFTIGNALRYKPYGDAYLCLVWVRGEIDTDGEKFCGIERHCLAMIEHMLTFEIMHLFDADSQVIVDAYNKDMDKEMHSHADKLVEIRRWREWNMGDDNEAEYIIRTDLENDRSRIACEHLYDARDAQMSKVIAKMEHALLAACGAFKTE